MDERRAIAVNISRHTVSLSEESLEQLAGMLIPRKLTKGELFLKEGEVTRSMGLVAEGMIRQFYR